MVYRHIFAIIRKNTSNLHFNDSQKLGIFYFCVPNFIIFLKVHQIHTIKMSKNQLKCRVFYLVFSTCVYQNHTTNIWDLKVIFGGHYRVNLMYFLRKLQNRGQYTSVNLVHIPRYKISIFFEILVIIIV